MKNTDVCCWVLEATTTDKLLESLTSLLMTVVQKMGLYKGLYSP